MALIQTIIVFPSCSFCAEVGLLWTRARYRNDQANSGGNILVAFQSLLLHIYMGLHVRPNIERPNTDTSIGARVAECQALVFHICVELLLFGVLIKVD